MEDDITICDNLKQKFYTMTNKETNTFKEKDCIFMGYHMFKENREKVSDIYDIESDDFSVKELNKNLYIGGTFCYSINKQGARKMVDYINKNGIKHGIDYIMKINPELICYETQPLFAFSFWNENDEKIDTDIQQSYEVLDFASNNTENFIFIQGMDQIGNDIMHSDKSISEIMDIVNKNETYIAFNTLGFIKSNINKLEKSPYFGKTDGIYIKNGYYKRPIRIKMLCNWTSSRELCKEWSNMCENEFCWKNIEITWTNEDIDYYVIINSPPNDEYYEPKHTIVFQMEPWVNDPHKDWGVKTWGKWATPNPQEFFKVFSHKNEINAVQWQLNIPLKELENTISNLKYNRVAAICSEKNFDEGHILRNKFISYIERHNDYIHSFGRKNYHDFISYTGTVASLSPDKTIDDKYHVLKQYKYCFAVENNSECGYATEKIWEPILCECLCFYWGCPNLEEYIDSNAFVRLPLDDFDKSRKIIKQAIVEDWWSKRIDTIRSEKQRIINELGFFPRLSKVLCGPNEMNIIVHD
jgi:hypothetical protein